MGKLTGNIFGFVPRSKIATFPFVAALLSACGPNPQSDPIFLRLKENPPTTIPERHLVKIRQGRFSCDVHNEGRADQYMTCWWPSGKPPSSAMLTYYGPSISRPSPDKIMAPGGTPLTDRIPLN